MRCPIAGSLNSPSRVSCSVTGFVTPLIVRSPVTLKSSAPVCAIAVLLKVAVGYLSTSRKLVYAFAQRDYSGPVGSRLRTLAQHQYLVALVPNSGGGRS